MSYGLFNSDDIVISERLTEVMPLPNVYQIENRLLDGSYHIHTVGVAAKKVMVEFYINETGRNEVNEHRAEAKPLTIKYNNRYYSGLIDGDPAWNLLFPLFYRGRITLSVIAEGVFA